MKKRIISPQSPRWEGQQGEKGVRGGNVKREGEYTLARPNHFTFQENHRPERRQPGPQGQGGGLSFPFGAERTPSPPPQFPIGGPGRGAGPSHSGGAVGNGLGGSQARREVSRAGAAPRGRDGGSEAGTRGIGGRGRDPSIPESSGPLAALAELGSREQPPPYPPLPPLLTSRCLSLRFHHNPSRSSRRHCPSHFPLSCLSRRGKPRQTPRPAKHERHFRPWKPRLPHPGCLRIGWSDGLPEAAGRGLGASCEVPAGTVGARVWLSTREC